VRALDAIDRRILEELQADGRASPTELARLVGAPVSTVHRRTNALLEEGRVRVGVLPNASSEESFRLYEVRLRCRAGRQRDVARVLSARSDMRWVAVVTGDYGVAAELVVPLGVDVAGVIFDDIEQDENILATQSSLVLQTYKGPDTVRVAFPFDPALKMPEAAAAEELDPVDAAILGALRDDGRMGFSAVAARTQMSESTVRRRIRTMLKTQRAEVISIVHPPSLGYEHEAIIRLDVVPEHLESVAEQLAEHPGVHHLAATFGETALVCEVLMHTAGETYAFLSETVARARGITRMSVEMELIVMKRGFLTTPWSSGDAEPAHARRDVA
jgi:DNA-binding Lrp family transcriptional regulator